MWLLIYSKMYFTSFFSSTDVCFSRNCGPWWFIIRKSTATSTLSHEKSCRQNKTDTHGSWRYIDVLWSEMISLCAKLIVLLRKGHNVLSAATGVNFVSSFLLLLTQSAGSHPIYESPRNTVSAKTINVLLKKSRMAWGGVN